MDMQEWIESIIASETRKAFPLMPAAGLTLTGIRITDIVGDGSKQAECLIALAARYRSAAAISFMDLSVEAEAFGSEIVMLGDELPTVQGKIVANPEEARALRVPEVGRGRTAEYLKAARLAAERINDRPVFGCHIGPFSLAGRLCGMTEALMNIHMNPDSLHQVLRKCTEFLIAYAKAFRDAGVDGIVMAEPAAGLISPAQCDAFSSAYVAEFVEKVQDRSFMVILHNCGSSPRHVPSMVSTGALGLHFGNAVDMAKVMPQMPEDRLGLGNIDPSGVFRGGTIETVREETAGLLQKTEGFRNFIISSGCDIPSGTPLENIDAFFETLKEYNASKAARRA